jgi:hypothetical protein
MPLFRNLFHMVGLPPGLGWIVQSLLQIDLSYLDLRVEGSDTYVSGGGHLPGMMLFGGASVRPI